MKQSLANLVALMLMLPGTSHAVACQAQFSSAPVSPIVVHLQILSPAMAAPDLGEPRKQASLSGAETPPCRVALKPSRPVRLDVPGLKRQHAPAWPPTRRIQIDFMPTLPARGDERSSITR